MTDKDTGKSIPISLGKPSLRRRLEDYYTLIAPDQLSNPHKWLTKFNTIYNKFGGTQEGERTLANKLTNKYGTTVRLLLVQDHSLPSSDTTTMTTIAQHQHQRDEDWYTTKPVETGNVLFTSPTFDCMAALITTEESTVEQINPFLTHQRLDNMSKFPHYLPTCDPCHRVMRISKSLLGTPIDGKGSTQAPSTSFPSLLVTMVESCATGPLSVLHRCLLHRQRIRVIIRYVNGIRASLTGYLIGFDVHFNLLMKDVLEVYNTRSQNDTTTPGMVEIHRRHHAMTHGVSQRQLQQLLVRGDTVVLCYPADGERSVIPRSSKSPKESLYTPHAKLASVPTPGSLLYAYHRRHSKQR